VVVGVGVDVVVSCCAWNAVSLAANDAPKAPHADALGGVVGSAGVVVGGSAVLERRRVRHRRLARHAQRRMVWLGAELDLRTTAVTERKEMPAAVKTRQGKLHTVSNI